jgi:hypothetical protein
MSQQFSNNKKSFADVELEKKVQQIFGISGQRPRTSLTR